MDANEIILARIEELQAELEIIQSQATMLKEQLAFLRREAPIVKLSEYKTMCDEYDEALAEVQLTKSKLNKLTRALKTPSADAPPVEKLAVIIPFPVKNDKPGSQNSD